VKIVGVFSSRGTPESILVLLDQQTADLEAQQQDDMQRSNRATSRVATVQNPDGTFITPSLGESAVASNN
jgi:hypothetical protein